MESKLSDEQRKKLELWINSKVTLIGKCPICSERRWTLLDDILDVRPFAAGNLVMGGPTYPHVGIMCSNCGNTQFINAIVSGILSQDGDTEDVQSPDVADAR